MTDGGSLTHMPDGPWRFDGEVTRVFDDMLERSVPEYREMRHLVHQIARRHVRPEAHVVDLGCSRGEALAPLVEEFGPAGRFLGVEVSPPMLDAARQRFEREIAEGSLALIELDLRDGYPEVEAALTLSVLTLQFTPVEHRARIVQDVFDTTLAGGAFILVEKVAGDCDQVDRLLGDLHRQHKLTGGYTEEAIERKRLSLEGVLMPATGRWNEDLLRRAGFDHVECFWRWANFAGWLALKT